MTTAIQTETKFSAWIKTYGVQKLVEAMKEKGQPVHFSACYQWLRADHEPRPAKSRAMVEISGGAITLADINEHFEVKQSALPRQ